MKIQPRLLLGLKTNLSSMMYQSLLANLNLLVSLVMLQRVCSSCLKKSVSANMAYLVEEEDAAEQDGGTAEAPTSLCSSWWPGLGRRSELKIKTID